MRLRFLPAARVLTIWLLISGLLLCGYASAQQGFSRLVIFGDSLSDTGNIAGVLTPNLPPPYFDNRISNGLLAVDVLASELGLNARAAAEGGDNWSIVGGNIVGADLGDLQRQVDRFEQRDAQRDESTSLFVIFMGGNDLRDLSGIANATVASSRISQMVEQLLAVVSRLQGSGAQHFLVVNAADIGRIPQTLEKENQSPGLSVRTTGYVQSYNALLAARLSEQARTGQSHFYLLDLFTAFAAVLDNPARFDFSVVDRGCFDPGDGFNPLEFSFDAGCDSGFYPILQPDFSEFVFFDSLHPTAAVHQLVGLWMSETLQKPPLESSRVNLAGVLLYLLDD